ncbi:hypothetical protein [Streptomyces lacrimifluminis]|nr:hypothetical protein [Streptomyces lacrimifluminis]
MSRDPGTDGRGRVFAMLAGDGSVTVRVGGVSDAVGDDDSSWGRKGAS